MLGLRTVIGNHGWFVCGVKFEGFRIIRSGFPGLVGKEGLIAAFM